MLKVAITGESWLFGFFFSLNRRKKNFIGLIFLERWSNHRSQFLALLADPRQGTGQGLPLP